MSVNPVNGGDYGNGRTNVNQRVAMCDGDGRVYEYKLAISKDLKSEETSDILQKLFSLHFDGYKLMYDGETSVYTSSRLPLENMEFVMNFNRKEVEIGFRLIDDHRINFDNTEEFIVSRDRRSLVWKELNRLARTKINPGLLCGATISFLGVVVTAYYGEQTLANFRDEKERYRLKKISDDARIRIRRDDDGKRDEVRKQILQKLVDQEIRAKEKEKMKEKEKIEQDRRAREKERMKNEEKAEKERRVKETEIQRKKEQEAKAKMTEAYRKEKRELMGKMVENTKKFRYQLYSKGGITFRIIKVIAQFMTRLFNLSAKHKKKLKEEFGCFSNYIPLL